MPRYYRRRYRGYRLAKSRYSNETTVITFNTAEAQPEAGQTFPSDTIEEQEYRGFPIVAKTTVYGTRKAKNFDLTLTTKGLNAPLLGCLVYVPQGTLASAITSSSAGLGDVKSLYEPNQNVIMQFMVPANGSADAPQITKVRTRLARNLDSGDSIVLIFCPLETLADTVYIAATVNYAIKY